MHLAFVWFVACAAHAPRALGEPVHSDREGPPDAMVREDLDCPTGDIRYTGGLGTEERAIVRTLEACGKPATYVWSENAGWARDTR